MSELQANKRSFFTSNRIIMLLCVTNLTAILLLINIHYNLSKVKKQKQLEIAFQDTLKFSDNQTFIEQTELHNIYQTPKAQIVMMGSSLTQRVHWNELLARQDIANRGIGSDIAEGYLQRVSAVVRLNPQYVFVEIGANDILRNTKVGVIFQQIGKLIDTLSKSVPRIVLVSCFLASERLPNYQRYNRRVDSLNGLFPQLLNGRNSLSILDINKELSQNGVRRAEFALADGIHLNAGAYLLWKKGIENFLEKENQGGE